MDFFTKLFCCSDPSNAAASGQTGDYQGKLLRPERATPQ